MRAQQFVSANTSRIHGYGVIIVFYRPTFAVARGAPRTTRVKIQNRARRQCRGENNFAGRRAEGSAGTRSLLRRSRTEGVQSIRARREMPGKIFEPDDVFEESYFLPNTSVKT